jgi:hypothetical protein
VIGPGVCQSIAGNIAIISGSVLFANQVDPHLGLIPIRLRRALITIALGLLIALRWPDGNQGIFIRERNLCPACSQCLLLRQGVLSPETQRGVLMWGDLSGGYMSATPDNNIYHIAAVTLRYADLIDCRGGTSISRVKCTSPQGEL